MKFNRNIHIRSWKLLSPDLFSSLSFVLEAYSDCRFTKFLARGAREIVPRGRTNWAFPVAASFETYSPSRVACTTAIRLLACHPLLFIWSLREFFSLISSLPLVFRSYYICNEMPSWSIWVIRCRTFPPASLRLSTEKIKRLPGKNWFFDN